MARFQKGRRWWCLLLLLGGMALLGAWLGGRPLTVAARTRAPRVIAPPEPDSRRFELPVHFPRERSEHSAQAESVPPIAPRRSVATERALTPALAGAEAYLFVGVDHTRGRWGRADSIVVAFFDDDTGHVGIVSVPRDLYVEIPDHGAARINATLRIANRRGQDPLALMGRVVGDVLAVPIDHVAVADLEAFERTINSLGGVNVDVPCSIADNFVDSRTPSGRREMRVEAGLRHLDGVTAAMYIRSRHGRSDWDRARRQQAVLSGLRARLREVGPSGWLGVLSEAADASVYTTMTRLQMLSLVRRVSRIAPERTHGVLIGTRQTEARRTLEGRHVLVANEAAIDEALANLFAAPAPGLRPDRKGCQPTDAALQHRAL